MKVPKVSRFQAKVPCQVSKEFQVKVPSEGFEGSNEGSEVPSKGSEGSK